MAYLRFVCVSFHYTLSGLPITFSRRAWSGCAPTISDWIERKPSRKVSWVPNSLFAPACFGAVEVAGMILNIRGLLSFLDQGASIFRQATHTPPPSPFAWVTVTYGEHEFSAHVTTSVSCPIRVPVPTHATVLVTLKPRRRFHGLTIYTLKICTYRVAQLYV